MEQIENKAPAKTKHVHRLCPRTVTAVTAIEDINRQNSCGRSCWNAPAPSNSSQTDATAINLGAYL